MGSKYRALIEKSLLTQSSSKLPQTLSLNILPSVSLINPSLLSDLDASALNVETSISSFRLKTCTIRNLFPMILEDLNIFLTCSGVAFVETSKSFALIPTNKSLTHPPTRYAWYPDFFNDFTTSRDRGLNLLSANILGVREEEDLFFFIKSLDALAEDGLISHPAAFL